MAASMPAAQASCGGEGQDFQTGRWRSFLKSANIHASAAFLVFQHLISPFWLNLILISSCDWDYGASSQQKSGLSNHCVLID